MAEVFGLRAVADAAVNSITAWKPTAATGHEQSGPNSSDLKGQAAVSLCESNDQNTISPDHPACLKMATAPTSSLDVNLGDIAQHTLQPNATKRFVFHKAPSSNGDLTSGFTYAKAVMPQLNMSRQKPANSNITQAVGNATKDLTGPKGSSSHTEVPLAAIEPTATSAMSNVGVPLTAESVSEPPSVQVPGSPFHPTITTTTTNTPPRLIEQANSHGPSSPAAEARNVGTLYPSGPEVAQPEHQSWVSEGTVLQEANTDQQPTKFTMLTETFTPNRPEQLGRSPKPQAQNCPRRTPKPTTPRQPQKSNRLRSKVMKSRPQTHPVTLNKPPLDLEDLVSKASITQEDLLHVLLTKYSREKEEREQIRVDHATEIHDLETLSHSLWKRLQESQQKAKSQESELTGLRARQPQFTAQIKKLRDYVQGLTNDQHGLRDSFSEMLRVHSASQASKQRLDTALEDARQTASDVDKRALNALKDARHETGNLTRIVLDQKAQLEKDAEQLQYERERSQRLEAELAKINASQQQSMHVFAEHANQVVQKMNSVLGQIRETPTVQQPESMEEVKEALRSCAGSLDELRQARNIKFEDLSQLETSVKCIADGITKTVQALHDDVKSSGSNREASVSELKDQLKSLSATIATERNLTKEIADFRMKSFELDAKLNVMENDLKQARQQVTSARDKELELLKQVAGLEFEAAALRREPQESPATALRLVEIASQNKSVQEDLLALKNIASQSSLDLVRMFEDQANMQLQKEDLVSQINCERAKVIGLSEERLQLEQQATLKFEEMRKDISLKAEWERNLLVAEHRLAHKDLKKQLAAVNESHSEVEKEQKHWGVATMEQIKMIADTQDAKERAEALADERLGVIDALTKERDHAVASASDRLAELKDIESAKKKDDAHTHELQRNFDEIRKQHEQMATVHASTESSLRQAMEDVAQRDKTIMEKEAHTQELQTNLDKITKQHEETATECASTQSSLRLAIADIDQKDETIMEKDAQIRGRDASISEQMSEVGRAHEAVQAAKVHHENEIRLLKESYQAAETSYEARIRSLQEELQLFKTSNGPEVAMAGSENRDMSPSKPRRKADRCTGKEVQQMVEDSQSQHKSSIQDLHTPRRESSPEMLDDGMEYIDPREIESLHIPPTPAPSSQSFKATVSFTSSTTDSAYFSSQHVSPSRSRPPVYANRTIKDSQDRTQQSQPVKRPSFETPVYQSMREHGNQAPGSQPAIHDPPPPPSVPRSILKSSNAGRKRTTAEAGLSNSGVGSKRSRRASTVGPGLGPVIPDSQSPSGSLHRARRTTKAVPNQGPKEDKYVRRFSQELNLNIH